MAVFFEDFVDIELNSGSTFRSFLNRTLGDGDILANRFGIHVLKNGEEVSLGGICTGYFIRSDGDTVVIQGMIDGARAYVDLPRSCYVHEGQFTLAIKITGGGSSGTMRIVDGTVANTTTGTVIDPGGIVPDLSDLMEVIERAEAAAAEIACYSVTEELISGNDYRLVISFDDET